MDSPDLLVGVGVDRLLGGDVPPAGLDDHLHVELDVVGQRGQDQVGVDHLDGRGGLDHPRGDGPLDLTVQAEHLGVVGVVFDDEALDAQDDVRDVFHHTGQRHELVVGPGDPYAGDRRAFQAAQEDPPQRVADRGPEAPLERLDGEPAVRRRGDLLVADNPRGQF